MTGKLRLKDVTVCAADCLHPALAARALEICLDKVQFADAVLFADVAVAGRFRSEMISRLRSLDDYSRFCLRELPKRIATPFVLVVQWDGYIVDPAAWTSQFLRYDYIGAPGFANEASRHLPWVVGNGGFSLRSRRLLDAATTLPVLEGIGEDKIICDVFRQTLERDFGIRFAPEELADRFCYQQRDPRGRTFGFHGPYNLYRVEDDDAVLAVMAALPFDEQISAQVLTLLHLAMRDGRNELARRLYALVRGNRTTAEFRGVLGSISGKPEMAAALISRLEALGQRPNSATAQ